MNWAEYLTYLNVKAPDAFSGMLGGLVKALVLKEKLWETMTSVCVGAITANFLGEYVAGYLDFAKINRGTSCFIAGITGMVLVQLLINKVKEKARHD